VRQVGVLIASGLIVGESLFGVGLAGLIVSSGRAEPLGLAPPSFAPAAYSLGALVFAAVVVALLSWAGRLAVRSAAAEATLPL